MAAASPPANLPSDLAAHIQGGGAVRTDASAPYAGRCGAPVVRRQPGEVFCRALAGSGTSHKGIGRCKRHPDLSAGLPPWVGLLPADVKGAVNHGRALPGTETHGATALAWEGKTIDVLFEQLLDGYDAAVFRATPKDPIEVLDLVIRLQVVSLARVNQWTRDVRLAAAAAGKHPAMEILAGPEGLAVKISSAIARLQESRAKYIEIDRKGEVNEGLLGMLSRMSDAEFAQVSANPGLLPAMMAQVV